jgi:hypothetical protein
MRATVIVLSPISGGLLSGRQRMGKMRPEQGAIKFIFVEEN